MHDDHHITRIVTAAGRRVRSSALAALLACVGLMALADSARAQSGGVEITRDAQKEWAKARKVISAEKKDWALGKVLLEDRIEVVQREIESLRAKIAESEEKVAKTEEKRAELAAEKDAVTSAVAAVKDSILGLEARTRKLVARLPGPLLDRIREPLERLPAEDAEDIKMSLQERFATVIVTLTRVNKFNREIIQDSERMTLANGKRLEVTTLYLGLGQGYYITPDGKTAGIGTAEEAGWVWTAANEFADKIAQAIAIYRSEKPAEFVPLPVRIR